MTRGMFATMPERADTKGSHWSKLLAPPLHSTSIPISYANSAL
jgi:hypothetical protein